MKKLFFAVLISLVAVFSAQDIFASHIQGMNITYKYIEGDTYEISCDFFRYCGGTAFNNGTCTNAAGLSSTAYFYIFCEDNYYQKSFSAPTDTVKEATPICAELNATQNSCVAGNCALLGIQWVTYSLKIALDSATIGSVECDNWMFVYSSGARNSGVNYVSQPSIVAYDRLNRAEFPTNSSVQFNSAKPIPFFCDGQEVTYNWSAYDPNGDSLWWELDTAWNSHNTSNNTLTSIAYAGAYTGPQPMPGTTTINNNTGQVNFTATIPTGFNFANYAIAVTVKEYQHGTGIYKGEAHRDIQFIVLDSCDNTPPIDTSGIVNFAGSGVLQDSNTIVVCVGQDFEFDLLFYDYDTAGNISTDSINAYCNIDQILPGAVWTTSHTNPDTVHISWASVPTMQVYVPFNVTVEDNFCPVTGFNVFSYVIRIEPSTFLGPDTAICSLDSITLNANGGDTFIWSVIYGEPIQVGTNFGCVECGTPWIHPSVTTMYAVESNLEAACGNTDTILVEVFDAFPIDLTPNIGGTAAPLVYCASDGLDTILSITPGGTYLGSGIVNPVDGVFAPDIVDPGSGKDTLIQIVYIIEGVCPNTDTLAIRVKGAPDASIATVGPFCEQQTTFNLQGNFTGTPSAEGWWDTDSTGNPTAAGVFNPSAFATPPNVEDSLVIYHLVNDSGCVNIDSSKVFIVGTYNSTIDSLPKICEGESVDLLLNDYQIDPFGVWTGKNTNEIPEGSGDFYFQAEDLKAGSYQITYEILGVCGSKSSSQLVINKLPDARIFGADSVYCDNITDSVLLGSATPGGLWGGTLNELHDGYFVPNRVGEGEYIISYQLYDVTTTCFNFNEVPVRIARTPVRPKVFGGGPYCQGTLLKNLRGDGLLSNTYKWYEWTDMQAALKEDPDSIPNLSDLTLLGAGNPFNYGELDQVPVVTVYGTQMSEYGCESDWSKVDITVYPAPNALFVTKDSLDGATVPKEVNFVNLSDAGDDSVNVTLDYSWDFGPFGASNEENPVIIFDEIGRYPIYLVADNSVCTDTHTIFITLDRIVKFFVPNVFTPNGDNKNDLFTWQIEGIKTEDFSLKIFNRWGTKVFETNDLTGAWDGKDDFLKIDAPAGTYFYVMQGIENTNAKDQSEFRGDLTLIRE